MQPLRNPRSNPRKARPLLIFLMMAVAAAASGCAFTRGDLGLPFEAADLSAVKQGQSSEADVVRLLGAPDGIIRIAPDRVAFHYYHYTMKHATLLVFSRVNIGADQLYVFFDAKGVVDRVLAGNDTGKLKFQFWPFGA